MSETQNNSVICIIDDDSVDRMILKRALKNIKPAPIFFEAKDQVSALDILQNNEPDIFIIDINLGAVKGFEIAEEFLNHPSSSKPKIVFMCGVVLDHEQNLAHKYTTQDILLKPNKPSENIIFFEAIQRFLGPSENL